MGIAGNLNNSLLSNVDTNRPTTVQIRMQRRNSAEMTESASTKPRLFPSTRFNLALICFFGCLVTYSLRSDLSFAIVCMAKDNKTQPEPGTLDKCGNEVVISTSKKVEGDFEWDKAEQAELLSAFFYGYLFSQVLGGYLAGRFGGKLVILATILGCSLLTLVSPVAARTGYWYIFGVRVAIGFFQGATFPAMHAMWSVWGPPMELSVLTGVTYAGAQIGNVMVLPMSGFLCQYGFDGGWPSIFYIFGAAGLVWCAIWMYMVSDRPANHPRISSVEKKYIVDAVEESVGKSTEKIPSPPILDIVLSPAVWACWFGHFAGDWGAYALLLSLPIFLRDLLGLDLSALGILSAVPYVAYFVVINVGGFVSDYIRSNKILGTLACRRAAMLVSLIGQAIFLVASSYCGCGQEALVIVFVTIAMALSGFQYSGFVVNYIDIAPTYSGVIMGAGNTIACSTGILSSKLVALIVKEGTAEEWRLFMWITAGILTAGALLFALLARGEVQPWAKVGGTAKSVEEVPLTKVQA